MYGTIAKMKAKKGAIEHLRKMDTERPREGYVHSYVFQSDTDPDELWLVALFKDKASYTANAASPEQDKEFRALMEFLVSEPEWHDGEVVVSS